MKMKYAIYFLFCLGAAALCRAGEPDKTMSTTETNKTELATLGGGCFWCMDAVFRELPGVKSVTCGYAGRHTESPTYEQVCTGATGHAEVIQIEFDPRTISYAKLLDVFWHVHDPTTPDRQGPDTGTQYRSIILYSDEAQKRTAEQSMAEAQKDFKDRIVTEIVPLKKFYRAEEYHQDYFQKHPTDAYCRINIPPKLRKLQQFEAKEKAH
jgi:peptide-methionine (S)-S-oxide reductase